MKLPDWIGSSRRGGCFSRRGKRRQLTPETVFQSVFLDHLLYGLMYACGWSAMQSLLVVRSGERHGPALPGDRGPAGMPVPPEPGQSSHQLTRRQAELRRASNRSRTPAWISLWFRSRYPDWAASISFRAAATGTQRTQALPRSASSCASAAVIGVSDPSETLSPKANSARSQRSVWAL